MFSDEDHIFLMKKYQVVRMLKISDDNIVALSINILLIRIF